MRTYDARVQPHDEPISGESGSASAARRTTPWLVGVLGLLLAMSAVAGLGWWAVVEGSEAPAPGGSSAAATDPGDGDRIEAAVQGRREVQNRREVQQVLDRLGRAVVDGDAAAYLALVDSGRPQFRARQARILSRLAGVPIATWQYQLVDQRTGTGAPAVEDAAWTVDVSLEYRFRGVDSNFVRERRLTFVRRDDGWLLADVRRARPGAGPAVPDIWDQGPITVARGVRSLVIASGRHRDLAAETSAADGAVRDVEEVWRQPWSGRPVVIVPRTQRAMAALIDSDGQGLGQIAAVTTGRAGSGPTRGDQIVVNPSAWGQLPTLAQRVVMAHEMTHLAARASTRQPVPIWLSEGFADYVAYDAVRLLPDSRALAPPPAISAEPRTPTESFSTTGATRIPICQCFVR